MPLTISRATNISFKKLPENEILSFY